MSDRSASRHGTALRIGVSVALGLAIGLFWASRDPAIETIAPIAPIAPLAGSVPSSTVREAPAAVVRSPTDLAAALLPAEGRSSYAEMDRELDPAIADVTDEGEHVMWPTSPAAAGAGAEDVELIEGEPVAAAAGR